MANKINVELGTKYTGKSGFDKYKSDINKFTEDAGSKLKSFAIGAAASFGAAFAVNSIKNFANESAELYKQQLNADTKLRAALKSTGEAAGLSFEELKKMASGLQDVTTYGDETIQGAQHLLLTFTKIGKDVFPEATEAVLNMATAMGTDLKSVSVQVGKALNDPIKGIASLTRNGVMFTEQQKEQIRKFQESGDIASAQAIVLRELQVEYGGLARAMAETDVGQLEQAKNRIGDLKELIGKEVIPMQLQWNELVFSLAEKFTGPITEMMNGWNYLLGGAKKAGEELSNQQAITAEIQGLMKLKKQQEDVITLNKHRKSQGFWFNEDELKQAENNVETLLEQIRELNGQANKAAGKVSGNAGKTSGSSTETTSGAASGKKKVQDETYASMSKMYESLRVKAYEEEQKAIAAEEEKNNRLLELQRSFQDERIANISDPMQREIALHEQKFNDLKQLYKDDAEAQKAIDKARIEDAKRISEMQKSIDVSEAQSKKRSQQAAFDSTVSNLRAAAEEYKAFGVAYKAAAIAQTTIDTYASATSSYKSLSVIPVIGPALGFAAAAAAVSAGLVNIGKISQQKFASGTYSAPGGYARVGEQGPEDVYLPRGATVFNTRETRNTSNSTSLNVTIMDNSGVATAAYTRQIQNGDHDEMVRSISSRLERIS